MSDRKRLLSVAIDVLRKERQKFAFDANLAKAMPMDPPVHAARSLGRYNELTAAMELLEELQKGEEQS